MYVGSRRCICNPVSGDGAHADYVARLLDARGFETYETAGEGDAMELGHKAGVDGVSEVAICGGDGTVNEVLRGLWAADHLDEVTVSVIPAGTVNLLAGNVGVRDIDHGIEVADVGRTETVDVGLAGGEPFIVSCIAGLPAEASVATSGALKERFGTVAFLLTGVQEALEFDSLDLTIDAVGADGPFTWSGEAFCLLVGNARRFVGEGGQANMEDGLLDVAIVEQMPPQNLIAEAIGQRIFANDTDGVTHVRAADIAITGHGEPITFSRDGELSTHERIDLSVVERVLDLRVGEAYTSAPEYVYSAD